MQTTNRMHSEIYSTSTTPVSDSGTPIVLCSQSNSEEPRRRGSFYNAEPSDDDDLVFLKNNLQCSQEIGRGSFGVVYLGTYLGDIVAVKELYPPDEDSEPDTGASVEEEFLREARHLAKKRSKHIVRMLHCSVENRCIVTEYCANGSLYDVIRDPSKKKIVLDWKNRLRWMRNVALGMNVVHNEPPLVLHRDLKSTNIFLDEHFDAKVGDFGLAKESRNGKEIKGSHSVANLRMIWQPPEVINSRKYSTKSDVYSFGVVMHEVLLLNGPYGDTVGTISADFRVNNHVLNGGGLPVPADRSELPGKWYPVLEKYVELMNRCCETEPEKRPEFDEISHTLKKIYSDYNDVVEQKKKEWRYLTLRNIFATIHILSIFICLTTLSLYSIDYWVARNSSAHRKENLFGSETASLVVSVCGLFGVFLTVVCLVVYFWRRLLPKLKTASCLLLRSGRYALRASYHRMRSNDNYCIVEKSPFEIPVAETREESNSNEGSVFLQLPNPELWKKLRQSFIDELEGNVPDSLAEIYQFCSDSPSDCIDEQQWFHFIQLLVSDHNGMQTRTWEQYQHELASQSPRAPPDRQEPQVFFSHAANDIQVGRELEERLLEEGLYKRR